MPTTPWNSNPPTQLYKLLPPDDFAFRWLETPEVFLKRADLFEDQDDCSVPIAFATSTRAKRRIYMKQIAGREAQDFSKYQQKILFRQREAAIPKDIIAQFAFDKERARRFAKHFVVLSLTEVIQEDDLWNKYAVNHSGFGIEFKGYDLAVYLNQLFHIIPVKVDYRDKIEPLDISYGMSGEGYGDIFRIKDKKKWSFEKEWRMMYYGFDPSKTPPNERIKFIDEGVIITIPDNLIANVYLGKNPALGIEERIRGILSQKNNHIPLIRV
jgi:hypothetical protein